MVSIFTHPISREQYLVWGKNKCVLLVTFDSRSDLVPYVAGAAAAGEEVGLSTS